MRASEAPLRVLCAWDRVEAHAAARKLAVVAELIRRNPEPGCEPEGPSRIPAAWDEFAADQLADALAESRGRAEILLDLAQALHTRLPGTMAALLDGTINRYKAEIITHATALLDDRRNLPLDHPGRPQLRHRTDPLPHLTSRGRWRPRSCR